ncbi:glycosyltransferase family 2 protein [bacterium]|nr:glycosyltransferase family 2 protein [bacterium]
MAETNITVGIVSFNTREATLACLRSLERVKGEGIGQVIIVDNDSQDDSVHAIARDFPNVRIIPNSDNRGFASGANQIIHAATTELVLILNPDTWVTPGAISRLLERANLSPRIAAVGAQIASFRGENQPSVFEMPSIGKEILNCLPELKSLLILRSVKRALLKSRLKQSDLGCEVTSVSGAAMLLRRSSVLEAGGFDERFFLYHEELDLCVRLKKLGYVNLFEPDAVVLHHDALASGYRLDRLPSDPVLTWRLQGKDLLFSKHFNASQLHRYRRIAGFVLATRANLLGLSGFFTGRSERFANRQAELKHAAECVRAGNWPAK